MNNLAATLWSLRDHNGAKKLEEQALVIREKILGKNHPHTLTTMNNLASTLGAMGDHQGARKLEERVLERTKTLFGNKHPLTTTSAWNLLKTLIALNDDSASEMVIDQDLKWLLTDDVELQDANQKQIREMLPEVIQLLKEER